MLIHMHTDIIAQYIPFFQSQGTWEKKKTQLWPLSNFMFLHFYDIF